MDNTTISKAKPPHKSMDYHFLRKEGIRHIRKLAGGLWTDYNSHDPGITLLEILCYAITDLGYRTSLPVQDLLAGGQGSGEDFYGITGILPCNPVTLTDLRKRIIDHKGIRNAWVEKNTDTAVNGFYDIMLELDDVMLDLGAGDEWVDPNFNLMRSSVIVDQGTENEQIYNFEAAFPFWDELSGIEAQQEITGIAFAQAEDSDIFIQIDQGDEDEESANDYYAELELILDNDVIDPLTIPVWIKVVSDDFDPEDPGLQNAIKADLTGTTLLNAYWQRIQAAIVKVNEVKAHIHNYRPLCEDFRSFRALQVQEISIRADVDLTPNARAEEVLAEIYHRIHSFLSPRPHFYTLEDLLNKRRAIEDIFEGPLLQHGFLDNEELEAIKQRDTIYTSDLMQLLTDIPGLIAVRDLRITNYYNNDVLEKDVVNCLKLASPHIYKPLLSPDKSRISFYKNHRPVTADTPTTLTYFETLKSQARQEKKTAVHDLPPPKGEDRETGNYFSIQHHFPPVYGIGEEGLPLSVPDSRRAKASQLKGYLLFFEQLLANYFSQLAHIRSLFSMEASEDKTYFSQPLTGLVPEADQLLSGTYEAHLPGIAEPGAAGGQPGVFHTRRNRFLDHLMARFNESFSEYALFLYAAAENAETAAGDLIADKIAFLQEYPVLSRDRARAFNYIAQKPDENDPGTLVPDMWNTENVSGLKKRIALLLGLGGYQRGAGGGFHLIEHLLLRPGKLSDIPITLPSAPTDPYSFRISFILPAEHPKLGDPDFGPYAESVIRSETPAHIIPHIYWLDNADMAEFETDYRNWLEGALASEWRNPLVQRLNNLAASG